MQNLSSFDLDEKAHACARRLRPRGPSQNSPSFCSPNSHNWGAGAVGVVRRLRSHAIGRGGAFILCWCSMVFLWMTILSQACGILANLDMQIAPPRQYFSQLRRARP